MEQLARIEARLDSLAELSDLVGALRSMAASRAREAQAALAGTRAYCGIVTRAIADIAPEGVAGSPSPSESAPVLLLVTSEHGFVGGFNTRLVEHAAQDRATDERLIVVGRRGQVAAAEAGLPVDMAFPMTSRVDGITPLARRIAARVSDVGRARIASAWHGTGAACRIASHPVLPLGDLLPGAAPAAWPPLRHLPAARLLQDLAAEYLFARIADALMESFASENGARLMAMDAASRNIDDRLETLRREERAARQEAATSDMLDLVSGTEAVNGHSPETPAT